MKARPSVATPGPTETKHGSTRSTLILGLVSLCIGSGAVPAAGSVPGDLPAFQNELTRAYQPLEVAEDAFSTGSLADALGGAIRLADVEPMRVSSSGNAVKGGLPTPIAQLFDAVTTARGISARTVLDRAALARASRLVDRHLSGSLGASRDDEGTGGDARLLHESRLGAKLVDRGLDRASLYGAGLLLARTIDAALPQLRALQMYSPVEGAALGCDVVNEPPNLCVGGLQSNVYQEDYALQIDLGGDDLYRNSAGGADPGAGGQQVAVVVDVSGNDRYEPVTTGAVQDVVMGSGLLGGIGMLVDGGGNDAYVGIATSTIAGLGYAGEGIGIVADQGGQDSYVLADRAVQVPLAFEGALSLGFGIGLLGGIGLAIDGIGNDSYLLEAAPAEPVLLENSSGSGLLVGPAKAQGFGLGGLGVGIFADGGGDNTMTARAVTAPVAEGETRMIHTGCPPEPPDPQEYSWSCGDGFLTSYPVSFGAGVIGGVGIALEGMGSSTWSAESRVAAPQTYVAGFDGMGVGNVASYGGLHDAGGNDSYVIDVQSERSQHLIIDDSCDCSGVRANAGSIAGWLEPGRVWAYGMGKGWFYGTGVLQDEQGNDHYEVTVSSTASASAIDERSSPGPGGGLDATADASTSWTHAWVQGAVFSSGLGVIEDLAGDDRYSVSVTSGADAFAESPSGSEQSNALTGRTEINGQAGYWTEIADSALHGFGLLRDLGGTDSYSSVARTSAKATPTTTLGTAPVLNNAQGSKTIALVTINQNGAGAWLSDLDGARPDTFLMDPPRPACTGTRGQGAWLDCPTGLAGGINT